LTAQESEVQLDGQSQSGSDGWQPETTVERELSVVCERNYCERDVFEDALIPVTVGGNTVHWCPSCAVEEFGEGVIGGSRGIMSVSRITGSEVTAFVVGVSMTLIGMSILIV